MKLDRRDFLKLSAASLVSWSIRPHLFAGDSPVDLSSELDKLRMFQEGYPQTFLFWTVGRDLLEEHSTEEAEDVFNTLQGVNSPCDRFDVFTNYKENHPEQLVYLFTQVWVFSEHRSRYDPVDRSSFFDGHWVYFEGSEIQEKVPAEEGRTEITVDDPSLFQVFDRTFTTPDAEEFHVKDDVGLCVLDEDGAPSWHGSEQVRLEDVDSENGTITVRRGMYGTQPRAFSAGEGYAAAHASAPWANLSWVLNFSPRCPEDEQGRQAADVLLNRLVSLFEPGGELHDFDGLNLDVARWTAEWAMGANRGRDLDTDADGDGDNGFEDGVNLYGTGFYRFCRRLRERLDSNKLVTADGRPEKAGQRAFNALNGIESEWWPIFGDRKLEKWSSGMNEHRFWRINARSPHFSYINHKLGGMGIEAFHDLPPGHHRLIFAAGMFTDAALTSYHMPEPEHGDKVTFWDEWVKGQDMETGWLGWPLDETVKLADRAENLLPEPAEMNLSGQTARTSIRNGVLHVRPENEETEDLRVQLKGMPAPGRDLVVRFDIRAEPLSSYPVDVAQHIGRLVTVTAGAEKEHPELTSYCNEEWFHARFYYRSVTRDSLNLTIEIQGPDPVEIKNITAHEHPDVMYREFQNGLVLANPAVHSYTFDLAEETPDASYRRINGFSNQDPETNNGQPVGDTVTLGERDGLFLVKQ